MSYNRRISEGYKQHNKKKIYLAHPSDVTKKEKKIIIKKLMKRGYEVVDPFLKEDKICNKYNCNNYYENPCKKLAIAIKNKDFDQLDNCESLFAWIPKNINTVGTMREFDRALDKNKHTIVIYHKPNPFLEDADELFLSIKDFLNDKQFEWK